jgi:hypothetical protein
MIKENEFLKIKRQTLTLSKGDIVMTTSAITRLH